MLIADLDIRVVDAATGELLRELVLDPTRDYQPRGLRPGPQPQDKPEPDRLEPLDVPIRMVPDDVARVRLSAAREPPHPARVGRFRRLVTRVAGQRGQKSRVDGRPTCGGSGRSWQSA